MSDIVMSTMSGAELKTVLGGLGLSPGWFADRMRVTMRTVVRWFDGDEVTTEVAAELELLASKTLDEMIKMLAEIPEDDSPVVLRTYRTDSQFGNRGRWPASWHRSLTYRVMEHLRAQGREVTVVYR